MKLAWRLGSSAAELSAKFRNSVDILTGIPVLLRSCDKPVLYICIHFMTTFSVFGLLCKYHQSNFKHTNPKSWYMLLTDAGANDMTLISAKLVKNWSRNLEAVCALMVVHGQCHMTTPIQGW